MTEWFSKFTRSVEHAAGSPWAFVLAALSILIWAVSGPLFDFSDTWQLVINTFTTLVTFLLVFIIQASQTRDTKAIQVKLDELLRVDRQARNELINLEDKTDEEIARSKREFRGFDKFSS